MQQLGSFPNNNLHTHTIPVNPKDMYEIIENLTNESHLDPKAKYWMRYRANADDIRGNKVVCLKGETLAEIAARGEIKGTFLETPRIEKIAILIDLIANKFFSEGGLEFILHANKKDAPFYTLPNLSKAEAELYKSYVTNALKHSQHQPNSKEIDRSTTRTPPLRHQNLYIGRKSNSDQRPLLFDQPYRSPQRSPARTQSPFSRIENSIDQSPMETDRPTTNSPFRRQHERPVTNSYLGKEPLTFQELGLANLPESENANNQGGNISSPTPALKRKDEKALPHNHISYDEIGFGNLLAEANDRGERLPKPPVIKTDVLGNFTEFRHLLEEADEFLIDLLKKQALSKLEKMKEDKNIQGIDPDVFVTNFVEQGLMARKRIREKGMNKPAPAPLRPITEKQVAIRQRRLEQQEQEPKEAPPQKRKKPASTIPTHEEFITKASKSVGKVLKDSGMTLRVSTDNKKKPIDRTIPLLGGREVFTSNLVQPLPSNTKKRKRQEEAIEAIERREAKNRLNDQPRNIAPETRSHDNLVLENKKDELLKKLRDYSISMVIDNIARLMNIDASEIKNWSTKEVKNLKIEFQKNINNWVITANLEALYRKKDAQEKGIYVRD